MKKVIVLKLFSLTVLCLMLLSGCNTSETHIHAFGEWDVVKEATCTEDGSRTRACECGEIETEVIAKGHTEETVKGKLATCTESGLTDGKKCSMCGEITVNQETITALGHDFESHTESDENGNPLTITTCKREDCEVIEQEYVAGLYDADNKLLASWDELKNDYRFHFDHEDLKSGRKVVVAETITDMSFMFHNYGSYITDVFVPQSVNSISDYSFWSCTSLAKITVDEANQHYKSVDGILYDKEMKTLIKFPATKELAEFTILDGVEKIGALAFNYVTTLTSIVIPDSVTYIGPNPFYGSKTTINIYYTGTAEQWESVYFINNWWSNNITVHYDSEKKFMAQGFAGNFGSSGAAGFVQIITTDGNKINVDYESYDTINVVEDYEFEYGEYVYSYIETRKEVEKLETLDQIQNCEKFYILDGVDQNDSPQTRICCYIDGVFYLLTVSDTNEETGTPIVNRINYSIIDWED